MIVRLVSFLVVAAVLSAPALVHADDARLRRFAMVIGANDGGSDRVTLRYAGTDARAVAQVVEEIGGVRAGDVEVVLDPSKAALEASFVRLAARMRAARKPGTRIELIVYYSGHSDENGLLLSGVRYGYDNLRQQIRGMPADVNIAILDSCASGAFTRTKGGKRRPAFVVDAGNQVRGHAFLSSSSADEAAQESDRIGASYFTHYLVSGLRGAADANRDHVVTLSEAYQFAYGQTVSRTRSTKHGPQHPAYDMHLVGTGDVVMTDLRATSAGLTLAADIEGRVFVHDGRGRLVVELSKSRGAPMVLGLGADRYVLTLVDGARRYRTRVVLTDGKRLAVAMGQFRRFEGEPTVARGGYEPPRDYEDRSVNVALVPGLSSGGTSSFRYRHTLSLNIIAGGGAALEGFELGGALNLRRDWVSGAQIAGVANVSGGNTRGMQVAGVGNWTGGDARVLRAAGVGNWTAGSMRGLELGGVGNWVDGSVRGSQFGGAANIAGGDVRGGQFAGAANIAGGNVRGAQVSGVTNVAGGDVRGAQVSGVANLAGGDVRGAQIGVVNIGGVVDGAQIGVVNIASRVDGMQLGVVNVADRSPGASIGLVNAIRHGHRAAELWASDVVPATVGVKFGSDHVYSMLAVGSSDELVFFGAGIGVHAPRTQYYLDIDLASYSVFEHDFGQASWDQLAQLRAMVGVPIAADLALFAGAQVSVLINYEANPGDDLFPLPATTLTPVDTVVAKLAPGFLAGISY